MKKQLFSLILLLGAVVLQAQKIEHPSLLFTPERVERAKRLMKQDTTRQRAWQEILKVADEQLQRPDLRKTDYLALAYLMTDDRRYADKAKETLLKSVKAQSWGNREMLDRIPAWNSELNIGHRSFACAVTYDAIYNTLSPADRKEIAEGLKRLALIPALGDWLNEPTRIHSLNSMGHNWWTGCLYMGGLLALSLQNELPELQPLVRELCEVMPLWFSFEGDVLQNKPKTFDRNGGMYESLNYANYGVQEALLYRVAVASALPKLKQPDIPQLAQLPAFFAQMCYPRNGILHSLNFGDSHKNVSAESSLQLLYEMGIGGETSLWYMTQIAEGQHRDGYFLNRPMGFLFTPDLSKAPTDLKLPLAQLYPDFGWAVMRDSWKKDQTMLAVKSGFTWNHSHADANSFVLFYKGIDIIKDAGNCWYPRPEYRNYFFQSQAHNVVLFNGQGQLKEQQYHGSPLNGSLHHLIEGDNLKYVLANGTGPVADNFSRNFRHFLWSDDVIYIIDDLKTHTYGEFEWLWHPGGEFRKKGFDVEITNGEASVVVRPLYPEILAKSDFVHDYPNDFFLETLEGPTEDLKGMEPYFSLKLPGKFNRVKGVTAVILKDSVKQKELPQMERLRGNDWIGLRITHKGKVTELYINQQADGRLMHLNSWITANGWTTDAYLFAITYPVGGNPTQPSDLFIAYGSALRRDNTAYFSSLSKLFALKQTVGNTEKIVLDGQLQMRASFLQSRRPASLIVNGKPSTSKVENQQLKIVIDSTDRP